MTLFEEINNFINLDLDKIKTCDINIISISLLKDLYYFIKEKDGLSLEYSIKDNYRITFSISENDDKIISGSIVIDEKNIIWVNLLNWKDNNENFFKYKLC